MAKTDYYITLEIERHTSHELVRKAYRRMAMKWHPDRHLVDADKVKAEAQFKLIKQAYETLGNPLRRAAYDNTLAAPSTSMFRSFQQRNSDSNFEHRHAEEMRRRQESLPRGADVNWNVKITFAEALRGAEVQYRRKLRVECGACEGFGWYEGPCSRCRESNVLQTGSRDCICDHCTGEGSVQWACGECSGKGQVEISETFKIRLPKGIADGSEIIVSGIGKSSRYGGLPGNLHIKVGLKIQVGFKFGGPNRSNCEGTIFGHNVA